MHDVTFFDIGADEYLTKSKHFIDDMAHFLYRIGDFVIYENKIHQIIDKSLIHNSAHWDSRSHRYVLLKLFTKEHFEILVHKGMDIPFQELSDFQRKILDINLGCIQQTTDPERELLDGVNPSMA